MSRADQIRHYTFHVAKLSGLLAQACEPGGVFSDDRVADLAVFGVKLSTVASVGLPDSSIDGQAG